MRKFSESVSVPIAGHSLIAFVPVIDVWCAHSPLASASTTSSSRQFSSAVCTVWKAFDILTWIKTPHFHNFITTYELYEIALCNILIIYRSY